MKKKSQSHLLAAVILTILIVGSVSFFYEKNLPAIWLIGILIGFVLYRAGLCFAASYQNMILFGEYSMARAFLLMIMVSFVGVNLIQIHALVQGLPIPGKFHSFGVHTSVGGFLFGLGMVLTGGCASGTLQRIGEGFSLFWIVLFGMILGSALGAYNYAWWVQSFISFKPVFLSDLLGWIPASMLTLILLAALLGLTLFLEKEKRRDKEKCQKKRSI